MRARLSLLLAVVCVLAGCKLESRQDARIHLEFWTMSLSPTYDEYLHRLIAEFESLHPEVELEWVDLPLDAARQKLMASIAGGVAPDLVNLNTELALVLAQNGALVAVSDKVPAEVQAGYFPGLWKAAELEGKVYAVPWYVTTRVLMYNKAIFRQAGLDPERPPETFEELAQMARTIRRKTRAVPYMPAIKIVNDWALYGVPIVDTSARPMKATFAGADGVARLEYYEDLYESDVIPKETLTESYRGALDRYNAGALAILEAGPQFLLKIQADAPQVYADTGVAPFPRTPTDAVPAATMNFVVPRASKHQELAIELGLFITSPKNQLEFDKIVPILPSTIETAGDEFFQKGKGEPLQDQAVRISIDQLTRARDLSLALPHQNDLNRVLKEAVEAALGDREVTAREALEKAAREWDRILGAF
ncbi:MAG: sugar ABC transporter substrate-binding protein [Armatimonadetes bacterium]|nr:sugar ABC transporter substrate-binding protein [Armatimonadota bacterium]